MQHKVLWALLPQVRGDPHVYVGHLLCLFFAGRIRQVGACLNTWAQLLQQTSTGTCTGFSHVTLLLPLSSLFFAVTVDVFRSSAAYPVILASLTLSCSVRPLQWLHHPIVQYKMTFRRLLRCPGHLQDQSLVSPWLCHHPLVHCSSMSSEPASTGALRS